jgi:hypothetical protein
MGLADLLSTPFLISLGITFLLVGILGIFLSQKIMDQNHKISSMLGLVTTMAEELNFIRSRFQMNNFAQGGALVEPVKREVENLISKEEPLIDVSDDEEEEDEESDEDEDEDEDEESDQESEEKLVIGEESQDVSTIKVIQMGESMTFKEQEQEQEQEDEVEEDDLEELEEVDESTFVTEEEEDVSSYAEESVAEEKIVISGADLKKMTIQNLRDIAVKKGFSGDVSKMKKADILKIVEGLL